MKDENTYREWAESPHSGVNQLPGRQPSPIGTFPARPLPQCGEDLNGERMSRLPSLRQDFPPTAGADKPPVRDESEEEKVPGSENPLNPVATFAQENEHAGAQIGGAVEGAAELFAVPVNAAAGAIEGMSELSKPTEDSGLGPESGVSAMDTWRQKFGGGR